MARRGVLNDRERLFVREYLIDLNATQAAIRAGYSPKSASKCTYRIFKRPRVRTYDMMARRALAILVEDIVGGFARRFGRRWDNFHANWEHYEFKTGKQIKEPSQKSRDEYAMANPDAVGDPPVTNIRDIRIFPKQIPIEFVVADAERRLGELVNAGIIDGLTRSTLIDVMIAESKRGTKLIGLFDYVGLYVNLLAASGHRARNAAPEAQPLTKN